MRTMRDGALIQTPTTEALGLYPLVDWAAFDAAEAATGHDLDPNDYLRVVEEVASGLIRKPTPDEIAAIKRVEAEARERRRMPGVQPWAA